MTQQDDHWLTLYFKLAVYQKSGMEFQGFFAKIMGYIDPDFTPIKPYGNWGDGGNDGCNSNTKSYYQIYAPLPTTKLNAQDSFNKAKEDYQKLIDKWGNVGSYYFVINDRFTGVEAPLQQSFTEFKSDKSIPNGKIIHTQELQKLFKQLSRDDKLDVLDIYHSPLSESDFQPTVISKLIGYLLAKPDMSLALLTSKAPDFDEKIEFNQLSKNLSHRLKSNSLEVYKIDEFLGEQDDESLAQELAQTVNSIYKELVEKIPDTDTQKNELIYLGLIEELIPKFARDKAHAQQGYNKVAEIVIAKYFETCDAYEDPNSTTSS